MQIIVMENRSVVAWEWGMGSGMINMLTFFIAVIVSQVYTYAKIYLFLYFFNWGIVVSQCC